MMAAGPYRLPNLFVEGRTAYTNRTPAGSTRAPSGPQVCWALEQHVDAVANELGMDPLALRLRNVAEEGDLGPSGQTFEKIGARESLEAAARLIDWGAPLPAGEGKGLALGWWFSAPGPSGAYIKLNADGSATIVTGAQENGSGSVMGLALLAVARARPADRPDLARLPGHRRRRVRLGQLGQPDDVQRGPGRRAGRRQHPRAAPPDGRRDARGQPGRPGARRRAGPGQGRPGPLGDHRGARPAGAGRRRAHHRRGVAARARRAAGRLLVRGSGLVPHVRRTGVLRACRPRPGRSRDRRRARAQGLGRPRLRASPQSDRRRGPGRGRHRPRHRHRPDRGRPCSMAAAS